MSIKLMTAAWDCALASGPKLVLLALCDNANDEGVCWPNVSTIMAKCSMGRSTVFRHLDELDLMGACKRIERPGKNTIYQIDPSRFWTRPDSGPVPILHTPVPIRDLPNKGNRQEPSMGEILGEKKAKTPKTEVQRPEDVEPQTWADWLKVRKLHKAPVTDTALVGMRREAAKAGLTLQQAVEVCCERSWRGFVADWLLAPQRPGFAAPAASTVPSRPGRDPTLAKLDAEQANLKPPSVDVRATLAALTARMTGRAPA